MEMTQKIQETNISWDIIRQHTIPARLTHTRSIDGAHSVVGVALAGEALNVGSHRGTVWTRGTVCRASCNNDRSNAGAEFKRFLILSYINMHDINDRNFYLNSSDNQLTNTGSSCGVQHIASTVAFGACCHVCGCVDCAFVATGSTTWHLNNRVFQMNRATDWKLKRLELWL